MERKYIQWNDNAKWTAGKDSKSRPSTRTTHTTYKTQTTHTSDSSGDDAERKKLKNVLNVLYDFSVGTSGSVPLPKKKRSKFLSCLCDVNLYAAMGI
jgi:hypothetical protein